MKALQKYGERADRDGRPYCDDVIWELSSGIKLPCEVKTRAKGFTSLYNWLSDGAKILGVKADYRNFLVVMELDTLVGILNEYRSNA
jgi:hypothetical protein